MRYLTAKEADFLRAHYRVLGGTACARALARPLSTVHHAAARLGFGWRRRRVRWTDRVVTRLRELHAAGFSDVDIASAIGASRSATRLKRCGLGLASNRPHPRQRAKYRDAWLRTCERYGVHPGDCLRTLVYRIRDAKKGMHHERQEDQA